MISQSTVTCKRAYSSEAEMMKLLCLKILTQTASRYAQHIISRGHDNGSLSNAHSRKNNCIAFEYAFNQQNPQCSQSLMNNNNPRSQPPSPLPAQPPTLSTTPIFRTNFLKC